MAGIFSESYWYDEYSQPLTKPALVKGI